MKLITKEIIQRCKELKQYNKPLHKQIVIAKFFNPCGAGTWYLTDYNPKTGIAFGYVSIFGDWNDEWGSFSIKELEDFKDSRFGLGIERDIYWTEKPVKEIIGIKIIQ